MACLSSHRGCRTELAFESEAASSQSWVLDLGACCILSQVLKRGLVQSLTQGVATVCLILNNQCCPLFALRPCSFIKVCL